jgi:hypothetical protein
MVDANIIISAILFPESIIAKSFNNKLVERQGCLAAIKGGYKRGSYFLL